VTTPAEQGCEGEDRVCSWTNICQSAKLTAEKYCFHPIIDIFLILKDPKKLSCFVAIVRLDTYLIFLIPQEK